jgi:hypothetical protein
LRRKLIAGIVIVAAIAFFLTVPVVYIGQVMGVPLASDREYQSLGCVTINIGATYGTGQYFWGCHPYEDVQ